MKNALLFALLLSSTIGISQHLSDYNPLNGYRQVKYYQIPDTGLLVRGGGTNYYEKGFFALKYAINEEKVKLIDSSSGRRLFLSSSQGYSHRYNNVLQPDGILDTSLNLYVINPLSATKGNWIGDTIIDSVAFVHYKGFTVYPNAQIGEVGLVYTSLFDYFVSSSRCRVFRIDTMTIDGVLDSVKVLGNRRDTISISKNHGWVIYPVMPGTGRFPGVVNSIGDIINPRDFMRRYQYLRMNTAKCPQPFTPLEADSFNLISINDTLIYQYQRAQTIGDPNTIAHYTVAQVTKHILAIDTLGNDSIQITIKYDAVGKRLNDATGGVEIDYDTTFNYSFTYKPSQWMKVSAPSFGVDTANQSNLGFVAHTGFGQARVYDNSFLMGIGHDFSVRLQSWPEPFVLRGIPISFNNTTYFKGLEENKPIYLSAANRRIRFGARPIITKNTLKGQSNRLKLSPNPAQGSFAISGLAGPTQVTIQNSQGRVVSNQLVAPGEVISTSHFTPGLYMVRAGCAFIKLVVE